MIFTHFFNDLLFFYSNFFILLEILFDHINIYISTFNLKFSSLFLSENTKSYLFWFPWLSFFNYISILSLVYLSVFFSIYNSENTYYIVLYMIFLIFMFSVNLVLLDLDIFAGLLLLIESVVVLMLFFLIIYLTPNINVNLKNQKWRLFSIFIIIGVLLSSYTYNNLSSFFFDEFSINSYFLEDFYEALNDIHVNELMGIYLNLYWLNSTIFIIVGFLLLIGSIICVVFVSYFVKFRNFNLNVFLNTFDLIKNCYSFIFLRKQTLAKQGRSTVSTRLFTKKTDNIKNK